MRTFLAGLGIGYFVGTLVAPSRGEEMRAAVAQRVKTLLWSNANDQGTGEVQNDSPRGLSYVLNHATAEELKQVRGIGRGLARRIIRHRPYKTGHELLDQVAIPAPTLERLKEKFDVRDATA
jgi:DNA uptake protein ComE-like DNA-binding protein